MRTTAIAAVLATMGCAAAPADAPEPVPAQAAAPGQCDTAGLQDLVGRAPTPQLVSEAQRRSGARQVRVIRPGDVVTMDYREDRLNIHVENERVARFACG